MNALKLIGMASIAVVLSMTIVSCSNDDDDNSGIVGSGTTEKKLVQIRRTRKNDVDTWNVSYDKNGRAISMTSVNAEAYCYYYTWSDNWVIEQIDDVYECTYYFTNGLISNYMHMPESGMEKTYYEYDSSKHLISVNIFYSYNNENSEYESTLSWDNGKLTNITSNYSKNSSFTFTYSGQTCNGYLPLIVIWEDLDCTIISDDDDAFFIVTTNPELMGLKLTQLPSSVNGVPFEYELDSDNYVISCVTDYESYTFLWE